MFDLPDLPMSLPAVALLVRGKLFLLEDNVDAAQVALRQAWEIAAAVSFMPTPVLYAWRLYLGENPSEEDRLSLYHSDGVHTSMKGAYLAACTIYAAITDSSPVGLAFDMSSLAWVDCTGELSTQDARELQEAAWKAVQ